MGGFFSWGFTQRGFGTSVLFLIFFVSGAHSVKCLWHTSLAQSSHYTRTIHPKKINLSTADACCTSVTSSPGSLVHLQRRLQLAPSVWRKWTVVSKLKSNLRKDDQSKPQLTGNTRATTSRHLNSVCSEDITYGQVADKCRGRVKLSDTFRYKT